ncbi:MAG: hypothetical protein RLZZ40_979 [Actinomycetota bacterium]
MKRILASETLIIAVLTVLFAGDFYRNLFTVAGWVVIALAASAWAISILVTRSVNWRVLPRTFIPILSWIAISPTWSPYALSSVGLTMGFLLTVGIGVALTVVQPLQLLYRRAASALRTILGASIVFEVAVALSGTPLYPVGMNAPAGTSIELAWCRGWFFEPTARIQGIVGNANLLGALSVLLLTIALVRLAERPRRPIIIFDVALSAFVFARTGSSTVLLAFVAVVAVWTFAWLARRPGQIAKWTIGAVMAAGLGAVAYALTHWPTFAALLGKSADMTHRFDIWSAVSERIAVRPITGFGFVGWWPTWEGWFSIHAIRNIRVSQAHNVWLDLAMQVGFIGVALFAVALAVLVWRWWRRSSLPNATHSALISVALATIILVQSLTESRALSEWGIALVTVLAVSAKRSVED